MALPEGALAPQPSLARPALVAGAEPLTGYRLIEPLGNGGFGEVWKCEVPGGLFKAIKFVDGGGHGQTEVGSPASRELEALEKVKAIRHPFLLSIERVEILNGVLIIVMELADMNLQGLLLERQAAGMVGIPRDELLGFLEEAAEALDVLNFQFGLQHLDVKPHNLFVISNHIKVGDFGLVNGMPAPGEEQQAGGAGTPLYAAPEVLQSSFSRQSDQYSLAIVYQQLLTGTVPFWSPKPYHLVMQHLTGTPNLTALPPHDQPVVARALAKEPNLRYPSCLEFVQALHQAKPVEAPAIRRSGLVRIIRPNKPAPPASENAPVKSGTARSTKQIERTVVLPSAADARARSDQTNPAAPAGHRPPARNADVTKALSSLLADGSGAPSTVSARAVTQATTLALPGFRFLTCLGRSPLVDLWTVQDPSGKERLAQCITGTRLADQVLTRLRELRHPAVPEREVFASPGGRTILLSDLGRLSLRDRFEECQAQGLPGIPRVQLLEHLRSAATALDELNQQYGLQHLGLNPGNLLIHGDKLILGDFGLISLVWIPAGNSAVQLNPRYAAPETAEATTTGCADQYSLALIFTEMLTGAVPRVRTANGKTGPFRRPGPETRSGLLRRPGATGTTSQSGLSGAVKVDLDLLPAADRPIILRALAEDPNQRFACCRDLVKALEDATITPSGGGDSFATLPLVIPFASLMGQPPPPTVLPEAATLVAELVQSSTGVVQVLQCENARYLVHGDGSWEYRCPISLFAGLLKLKLQGFREHWGAQLIREDGPNCDFRIGGGEHSGRWLLFRPSARRSTGIEVRLQMIPGKGPGGTAQMREAVARLFPCGGDAAHVHDLASRIFQSLRAYLQGVPEQRSEERYPFSQTFHVYPVLPSLELAGVLEAKGRNISHGGMQFLVTDRPATDYFYLHFRESATLKPLALLCKAKRVAQINTGQFEIAVTFAVDAPHHP